MPRGICCGTLGRASRRRLLAEAERRALPGVRHLGRAPRPRGAARSLALARGMHFFRPNCEKVDSAPWAKLPIAKITSGVNARLGREGAEPPGPESGSANAAPR
jgi:hypothetical protein